MDLEEGVMLRGHLSLTGGDDGPHATWIVVAPHGKQHLHSIDNPLEMHCWPAAHARQALEAGTLERIGSDPAHPAVQLQRRKEALGVVDAHLGLDRESIEKMLSLLEQAIAERDPLAWFAGGEVLSLMHRHIHRHDYLDAVEQHVRTALAQLESQSA